MSVVIVSGCDGRFAISKGTLNRLFEAVELAEEARCKDELLHVSAECRRLLEAIGYESGAADGGRAAWSFRAALRGSGQGIAPDRCPPDVAVRGATVDLSAGALARIVGVLRFGAGGRSRRDLWRAVERLAQLRFEILHCGSFDRTGPVTE